MSYWDTSTLAKLYVREPDSPSFEQKAAIQHLIVTSKLSLYETGAWPFARKVKGSSRWGQRKPL